MLMVARLTRKSTENSESLQSIHAPNPIQFSTPDARITDTLPADLVGMFVNENQNPWQLLIDLQRMFEGDTALTSVCMAGGGYGQATFSYTHFDAAERRQEM